MANGCSKFHFILCTFISFILRNALVTDFGLDTKMFFWLFCFDFWRAACLEYLILVFKLTSLGPQQVEFDIPLISLL